MNNGYAKFRGKCKELSDAACIADPTLTLVRGYYFDPVWGRDEHHWWTVRPDGTIYDPTCEQFPSRGSGIYTPFNGVVECAECGKELAEELAYVDGKYAFCGYGCQGRFIGVF